MADETQPLIDRERTYNPISDSRIDTERAYEIFTQYIVDAVEGYDRCVSRIEDAQQCVIRLTVRGEVSDDTITRLLQMENVKPVLIQSVANPVKCSIDVIVEDEFTVPKTYQPSRPDAKYIESLFRPKNKPEFDDDGWAQMVTDYTPPESSLQELERVDNYTLCTITHEGSGTYYISVEWLGDDSDT